MSPIALSAWELVIAGTLVVASATLSMVLALGLQRSIVVAAVRTVAQLLVVGLFLRRLFALETPWVSLVAIVVMLGAATLEVASRQERRLRGFWHYGVGGATMGVVTVAIAGLALTTALRPTPWYAARQAIPLTGMLLGTVMNAASVSLDHVTATVTRERAAIEARLCLGDDRYTAFHDLVRRSVRAGMIPLLNQMAAAGVITMPGIMTGQILAGVDPLEAGKMQVLLMFLLAGGAFFTATGAVYLAVWRLTDDRDRLRLDRLDTARRS